MKRSHIAAAALAAIAGMSGVAHAQSTVTLSGTLDTGFQKTSSGEAFKMVNSRNGTSNWTIRGQEDLGGGLKAVFQVSTSFNSDEGTVTSEDGLGNNGMFVGLTGGFGTVRLGRPVHLLWDSVLSANGTKGVSGYAAVTTLDAAGRAGALNGVYAANSIQYFSPAFSGLSFQLEYAPSESTAPSATNGVGVGIRYSAGPISATFTNYKAAAATENKAVNQLGFAYDFQVAKAFFTWRDQSGKKSNTDNAYVLGVTAPVGPGLAYASLGINELADTDGRRFIAGYKYNLSKRTLLYVNVASANAAANVDSKKDSTTGYGFGLQHNF